MMEKRVLSSMASDGSMALSTQLRDLGMSDIAIPLLLPVLSSQSNSSPQLTRGQRDLLQVLQRQIADHFDRSRYSLLMDCVLDLLRR